MCCPGRVLATFERENSPSVTPGLRLSRNPFRVSERDARQGAWKRVEWSQRSPHSTESFRTRCATERLETSTKPCGPALSRPFQNEMRRRALGNTRYMSHHSDDQFRARCAAERLETVPRSSWVCTSIGFRTRRGRALASRSGRSTESVCGIMPPVLCRLDLTITPRAVSDGSGELPALASAT